MISIVVAMDEKRGIGKDNKIPWHIPEDLKRFHRLTDGHPVIMGRKTFESILTYTKGKPLSNRHNIVVTRDPEYTFENVLVVHSLPDAVVMAKKNSGKNGEIFIIGGAQIFTESIAAQIVDRLYLTIVKGDHGADTFFPEYENEFGKVLHSEAHESSGYHYTFLDLEKSEHI